jgi:putative transposase
VIVEGFGGCSPAEGVAGSAIEGGGDASIGSVGDALDNALMESTIGLYKTELIKPGGPWRSLAQIEVATAEWVDWYNRVRLHSAIGYVPPAEYESTFYAQPQPREVVGANSPSLH